jgi:SpoVK/Ycf46/Vps4 family AAA+-type ATPase
MKSAGAGTVAACLLHVLHSWHPAALATGTLTAWHAQVVYGGELTSDIVGDTEKVVRGIFTAAKALVPCVLLLDECDRFSPPREGMASGFSMGSAQGASGVAMIALGTLMQEMDALDDLRGDAAYATLPLPRVACHSTVFHLLYIVFTSACGAPGPWRSGGGAVLCEMNWRRARDALHG